jgi:hypothetical protein
MVEPVWGDSGTLKPRSGGIWTSPLDSAWAWEDWCLAQGLDRWLGSRWVLDVAPGTRLLRIDSMAEMRAVHAAYGSMRAVGSYECPTLDFPRMAADVDGLWLTERGFYETRWPWEEGWFIGTSGWDCETVLFFRWRFTAAHRTKRKAAVEAARAKARAVYQPDPAS